jgi:hypothetical protein
LAATRCGVLCCPRRSRVTAGPRTLKVLCMQYDTLALACLRAGRGERAEELFEERDYL